MKGLKIIFLFFGCLFISACSPIIDGTPPVSNTGISNVSSPSLGNDSVEDAQPILTITEQNLDEMIVSATVTKEAAELLVTGNPEVITTVKSSTVVSATSTDAFTKAQNLSGEIPQIEVVIQETSTLVDTQFIGVRLTDPLIDESLSAIDLDTFQVTAPDNPDADIALIASVGSKIFYFLEPLNGARFVEAEEEANSIDCRQHESDLSDLIILDLPSKPLCGVTKYGTWFLLQIIDRQLIAGTGSYVEFNFRRLK